MTKTLTEQWREGTLNGGIYYLKMKDGEVVIDFTEYQVGEKAYQWEYSDIHAVKSVLAPVPSYEEYQDIIQQNVNQESAIETYIEDIKHLQEQLKEANAIIEDMRPFIQASMSRQTFARILNYEDKWGVK